MVSSPYMQWAKARAQVPVDLGLSNVVACALDDLPGAREALTLDGHNDDGYPPLLEAIADRYRVPSGGVDRGDRRCRSHLLAGDDGGHLEAEAATDLLHGGAKGDPRRRPPPLGRRLGLVGTGPFGIGVRPGPRRLRIG